LYLVCTSIYLMYSNLFSFVCRMIKTPVSILYTLVLWASLGLPAQAADFCNPDVDPDASDTTLIQILSRIAEKYEFILSVPVSLDRPVRFNKSMPLDRLIKRLTADMNTVLMHGDVIGCAAPVLMELIILPNGQESDSVTINPSSNEPTVEYVYIDDMDSYVTGVIEGKLQPELERMTPEQRAEYEILHELKIIQKGTESSN
jgi:hypothetical protein